MAVRAETGSASVGAVSELNRSVKAVDAEISARNRGAKDATTTRKNRRFASAKAAVGASLTGDAVAHKDLDATGVPVLVITSTDDVLSPSHLVIDSAQRLANASIVEVAGAGHSTYFERPDLYNDALIAFIEKAGRWAKSLMPLPVRVTHRAE
jgi:pimeloyl-ACP methyl ester carboxylesterase